MLTRGKVHAHEQHVQNPRSKSPSNASIPTHDQCITDNGVDKTDNDIGNVDDISDKTAHQGKKRKLSAWVHDLETNNIEQEQQLLQKDKKILGLLAAVRQGWEEKDRLVTKIGDLETEKQRSAMEHQNEKQRLTAEFKRLQTAVETSHRRENEELAAEIEALKVAATTLRNDNERLAKDNKEATQYKDSLLSNDIIHPKAYDMIERRDDRIEILGRQKARLEKKLAGKETTIGALEKEKQVKLKMIRDIKKTAEADKALQKQTIAEKDNTIRDLREEADALVKKNSEVERNATADKTRLEKMLSDKDKVIGVLDEEAEASNLGIRDREAELERLMKSVASKDATIEELEKAAKVQDGNISRMEERTAEMGNTIAQLKQEAAATKETIAKLVQEATTAKKEHEDLLSLSKRQIKAKDENIAALEKSAAVNKERLEAVHNTVSAKEAAIATLEQEVSTQKKKVTKLEGRLRRSIGALQGDDEEIPEGE